ncbi:MAG: beta-N-acetylhexosaminidase [Planctomycetota bacterium]
MSDGLDRSIAKLLGVGFASGSVDASLRALLDRGVGGVVLFSRNVGEPGQVAELQRELSEAAGRPLLRMVDQEGGRVARLREGFTVPPSMRALGRAGDADLAEAVGRLLGRELAAVGFNVNLAPVLDLATNGDSRVIGDRSLGTEPGAVSAMAGALIRGIESTGVASCGKHFPGHGDTPVDSHVELPRLGVSLEVMRRREFVPFEAAIAAGVSTMMPGHLVIEALDAALPATMSRSVVHGLLREAMGFEGLIISDDLEMGAIAEHFGVERAVVAAVNAGVDLLMVSHRHDRVDAAIEALRLAVERGEVSRSRIEDAGRRIDRLAARCVAKIQPTDWRAVVGCDEHRRVVDAVLKKASIEERGAAADPTVGWRSDAADFGRVKKPRASKARA